MFPSRLHLKCRGKSCSSPDEDVLNGMTGHSADTSTSDDPLPVIMRPARRTQPVRRSTLAPPPVQNRQKLGQPPRDLTHRPPPLTGQSDILSLHDRLRLIVSSTSFRVETKRGHQVGTPGLRDPSSVHAVSQNSHEIPSLSNIATTVEKRHNSQLEAAKTILEIAVGDHRPQTPVSLVAIDFLQTSNVRDLHGLKIPVEPEKRRPLHQSHPSAPTSPQNQNNPSINDPTATELGKVETLHRTYGSSQLHHTTPSAVSKAKPSVDPMVINALEGFFTAGRIRSWGHLVAEIQTMDTQNMDSTPEAEENADSIREPSSPTERHPIATRPHQLNGVGGLPLWDPRLRHDLAPSEDQSSAQRSGTMSVSTVNPRFSLSAPSTRIVHEYFTALHFAFSYDKKA
jgi:hypothetical protein